MDAAVRVVIQARFGSSRLSGKILASLGGRPMLAHVVRRMQAASPGWQVHVATTTAADDDATQQLCRRLAVPCFRGREDDVLARYLAATADLADDDLALRATADNPLYCPRRSRALVERHCRDGADYTSIENLSYVVPEVFRVGALRAMARLAGDPESREHVTPFFRRRPHRFTVTSLAPNWQGLRPDIRLSVDTPGDLDAMRLIFDQLGGDDLIPLERVYAFCDSRPGWTERKTA
jgi:spore coat polysaccharide biosynthesis protein SpsF